VNTTPLILRGGSIFDPRAGSIGPADVRLSGTVVDAIGPDLPSCGGREVDVTGLLLTPGWVDLHTHVFVGQDLGVDPAALGPASGVTTMIDAGSAGAHLFGAFAASTLTRPGPRIRNFLNISSVGTTSIRLSGELRTLAYADESACVACAREHPGQIIGVKVRASRDVAGENGPEALRRARRVADALSLPLMVHVGPPLPLLPDVLAVLGAGDIVTHSFTALAEPTMAEPALAGHGRVLDEAWAARQRGVLIDVGHGMSGFDARVAGAAVRAGFLPDTISTDAHAYSIDTVGGLPSVATKFMALGLTLAQVLERVTLAPARAAGLAALGVGRLTAGGPGDVAAIRVIDEAVAFVDPQGNAFSGQKRIQVELTVQAGSIVFDGRSAPGAPLVTE
jgi:dihydroorotase